MRQENDIFLNYIEKQFIAKDPNIEIYQNSMRELGPIGMSVSPVEAKILQVLIQMIQAKKIIELGCFAGFSAYMMSQQTQLEQNPMADFKIHSFEMNANFANKARENFARTGVADKIQIHEGKALDNLKKIEDQGPFDLIFIDADKPAYCQYLDWAEQNIRKGGIIIGDNTFLFGAVVHESCPDNESEKRWKIMREFNARLADSNKYTSIMLPTVEGMTIAIKNF